MNSSLHISLITDHYTPELNGSANPLAHLVEGLSLRGHQLQLVQLQQPHQSAQPFGISEHIAIKCWPLPAHPELIWGGICFDKLLQSWQKNRPDIIYIASEGPLGLSAMRAAKRLQIACLSSCQSRFVEFEQQDEFAITARLRTSYLRWFHNRSQLTLAPSNLQLGELKRRGFEHLALLEHGVDVDQFQPARRCPELRKQWGLRETDLALFYVAHGATEKNLKLLARTLQVLRSQHPERQIKLIIRGNTAPPRNLQRYLPEATVSDTNDPLSSAKHYASADILLLANASERFSYEVLQALACGLAVVAFEQSVAAQYIRHGHNGWLVANEDERAFIQAICQLLDDQDALRNVRLNARRQIRKQSWQVVIEQFEGLLHKVCKTHLPPAQVCATALNSAQKKPRL